MNTAKGEVRRAASPIAAVAVNWTVMAVLVTSACVVFSPATPLRLIGPWAGLAVVQLTLWAVLSLRLIPGTPSRTGDPPFWLRAGKLIALGNNVVVVSGIWLLAPYGPVELRMIAMLFCVSYIAIAILATPNFGWVHYVTTISAIGSLMLVTIRGHTAYSAYLTPFFIVFAAGILLLGQILHTTKLALGAARVEAEAQRDARLHFLDSASHDFGQPLQAARLYYDQMLRSAVVAERQKAAHGLERALDAMEQMVTHVTNHLRLDAGAVAAARDTVSVGQVIAQAVEMSEPSARLKGVHLRMLSTRLVVRGDALLIERAMGNLIGNAIRHAQAKRILVGPKRQGDRVRLWVLDDGRGVALADQATLFDPYVRGSDHAGEIRGGYGLGLSAARMMAAAMEGEAGYEPGWKSGGAFFLELPAACAERHRAESRPRAVGGAAA